MTRGGWFAEAHGGSLRAAGGRAQQLERRSCDVRAASTLFVCSGARRSLCASREARPPAARKVAVAGRAPPLRTAMRRPSTCEPSCPRIGLPTRSSRLGAQAPSLSANVRTLSDSAVGTSHPRAARPSVSRCRLRPREARVRGTPARAAQRACRAHRGRTRRGSIT
jgi:hypothetical protein